MATIREVAARAGVSLSTVSIIINGQAQERKISAATCQRVWDAVRELDYQPNIAARKLRQAGGNAGITIALYWANDFRTTMLSRFLQGLQQQLAGRSDVEIVVMTYLSGQLSGQRSLLEGRRFHAAIIGGASEEDLAFLEQEQLSVPLVIYNRESSVYPCVTVDERKMGQQAAEKLLALGHKNICMLSSPYSFAYMRQRDEGVRKAFAAAGYPIYADRIFQTESSLAGGAASARRLLDSRIPCTALYCASDAIALGALRTLYDRGVRVPGQMSVISIGNGEPAFAGFSIPALTNVYLPMEEMAQKCLEIALQLVETHQPGREPIFLDTPLIVRESVGPAPGADQFSTKSSR
jgi:DNA-binding LacI/PurR family transcriptional regulator